MGARINIRRRGDSAAFRGRCRRRPHANQNHAHLPMYLSMLIGARNRRGNRRC